MFVSTQNSYVEILTPNVMELGGGVFGRSLGHEGESRFGAIRVLIKGTPESSPSLFLPRDVMRL